MEIIEYDSCCLTSSSSQLTDFSHFLQHYRCLNAKHVDSKYAHQHLSHFDRSDSAPCTAAKVFLTTIQRRGEMIRLSIDKNVRL